MEGDIDMRRAVIGLVTGVAIWVGSAVAAEAQTIQIQPVGPTSVKASDTFAYCSDSITPGSTNPYWVRIEVFVNGVSVMKTSPPDNYSTVGTKSYLKAVNISGLHLQPGQLIRFRCECSWNGTDNFPYYADTPDITVGS